MSVSFPIIAYSFERQQGFKSPFGRDNLHKRLLDVRGRCLREALVKCQTGASMQKW